MSRQWAVYNWQFCTIQNKHGDNENGNWMKKTTHKRQEKSQYREQSA